VNLYSFCSSPGVGVVIGFTTKKPEKTNRITNRIFPSVIITDRNNSVSKSVGIYRPFRRWGIQFVWKYATAWWRQTILPTEWPRDSNWDSRTVMWHCHRRNHRWNHRRKESVGDSIGKNHYIPTHLPTLSSSVSSSFSFPSHLSPPKLQPTTHPNSPLFSTRALKLISYILYVVTISVSCRFYHFFCK